MIARCKWIKTGTVAEQLDSNKRLIGDCNVGEDKGDAGGSLTCFAGFFCMPVTSAHNIIL